jgi:hypothetical protein
VPYARLEEILPVIGDELEKFHYPPPLCSCSCARPLRIEC